MLILLGILVCFLPDPVYALSFTDPFLYCAAFADTDGPDERYAGESPPKEVLTGLRERLAMPGEVAEEALARGTFWRCMGGKVMACFVGANLPCTEKADVSRTPSGAMGQFCRDNPSAAVMPAVVTGRATVYEWRCLDRAPQIVRQVAEPDRRGFIANIWHEIPEPQR